MNDHELDSIVQDCVNEVSLFFFYVFFACLFEYNFLCESLTDFVCLFEYNFLCESLSESLSLNFRSAQLTDAK